MSGGVESMRRRRIAGGAGGGIWRWVPADLGRKIGRRAGVWTLEIAEGDAVVPAIQRRIGQEGL